MNVLIIGAGAAGIMAAWRLAEAGHQVTVLEQFKVDHDRGSSYGESRIVRRVYTDPLYTALMDEAYTLWDELQSSWNNSCPYGPESNEAELIRRYGGLFFGPAGNPDVASAEEALRLNRVDYEKLSADEVQDRYPEFRLPAKTVALFEPTMGYARASHTIRAAAYLACRSGARIVEDTTVAHIDPSVNRLSVTTVKGERFAADRILITAGAWTAGFLAQLGIAARMQVTRQVYVHLERVCDTNRFDAGKFPTWIDIGTNTYGFPQIGSVEGVKIACHNRGEATLPAAVQRSVSDDDRGSLLKYAASHFVGLSNKIVYEKVCLYTNTPDEDFVIDEVRPGVFVISACSGHGFKFAPLIGQIGMELVLNKADHRNLSRFRLSRLTWHN